MKPIEMSSTSGLNTYVCLEGEATVWDLLKQINKDPRHYTDYSITIDKQPANLDSIVKETNRHVFFRY